MAVTQSVTIADIQALDTVAITVTMGARAAGVDPRTFSQGVADGTIPSVKIGRRVLVPRLPFLALFGAAGTSGLSDEGAA